MNTASYTLNYELKSTSTSKPVNVPRWCEKVCIILKDGTKIYVESSEYLDIRIEEKVS